MNQPGFEMRLDKARFLAHLRKLAGGSETPAPAATAKKGGKKSSKPEKEGGDEDAPKTRATAKTRSAKK